MRDVSPSIRLTIDLLICFSIGMQLESTRMGLSCGLDTFETSSVGEIMHM